MAAMTATASSCGGVAAAAAAAGAAAAAAASSGASTASAAVAGAAAAAASTAGASSAGANNGYNFISCIHGLCSLKRMRTYATNRLHACIDAVLLLNNRTTQRIGLAILMRVRHVVLPVW